MEKTPKARNTKFSASVFYRLDRFVTEVRKASESRLREVSGMSFSQFLVLMALVERGELRQSQIADYAGVTPAVITKQVEQLAGQGLLHLGPAHDDRRANVVKLTAKGTAAAQKAQKAVEASFHDSAKFPDHYRQKLSQWLDAQDL